MNNKVVIAEREELIDENTSLQQQIEAANRWKAQQPLKIIQNQSSNRRDEDKTKQLKVIKKEKVIDKYNNDTIQNDSDAQMNKVAQNQLPLSASFKSNYAKELEMQIKERDRIKRIESDNREYAAVKKISYDDNEKGPEAINRFSSIPNAASFSPSKSSSLNKDRNSLGSAPKAVGSVIVGYAEGVDPFGGSIPIRKKISNRIDQELESCGSIFSGRDERGFLAYKRNLQQQNMREELLRQIEEKNKREEDHKRKRKEEDINDEFRIKQELQQIGSQNEPTYVNNFNKSRGK